MQNRKRNVSCCPRSIRGGRQPSAGKRSAPLAPAKPRTVMDTAKILYIEWVDAVSDGSWEENVIPDIHFVKTIGFLISETKDAICIASTVSSDYSNARMHIPKIWIKKRKEIKLDSTNKKSKPVKVRSDGDGASLHEVSTVQDLG